HECDVAAKQGAALACHAIGKARRDRADAGDRHYAKGDTSDENVEAAEPAAQFAQGVAQRKRGGAAAAVRLDRDAHEAALPSVLLSSIRPERSRTTRSQRCASALS